jgi:predicted acylesterase/phospholipase RssA
MPADAHGPFGPIALSFSGGGARAVGFHVGVLVYLDRLGLLEDVAVLSTVSGGTFVGTSWALSVKEGVPFARYFADTYRFLGTAPFFDRAIQELTAKEPPLPGGRRTLATAIAKAWDVLYFKGRRFEIFWRPEPEIHLEEITFNATDFKSGIAFRFQKSAGRARIGNARAWITDAMAQRIRMADIMSASSAIPGGVEPLAFPQDFAWPGDDGGVAAREEVGAWLRDQVGTDTIPLMDGGAYDNQGIDSVLLAEQRRLNRGQGPLGLFVICDTRLRTDAFYTMPPPPPRGTVTFTDVNRWMWGLIATAGATVAALLAHFLADTRRAGITGAWRDLDDMLAFVVPMILALALGGSLLWGRWKVRSIIADLSKVVSAPWSRLERLTTNEASDLLKLRIGSILALTDDIYMNRIRSLSYAYVFTQPDLKNRIVANEIYDVVTAADRAEAAGLPEWLTASPAMVDIAKAASTMGTKLWLEAPPPGQHGELDGLIACAQMTTCYNLVRHMALRCRKPDGTFTDPRFDALWRQAYADWTALRANPYAFVPSP